MLHVGVPNRKGLQVAHRASRASTATYVLCILLSTIEGTEAASIGPCEDNHSEEAAIEALIRKSDQLRADGKIRLATECAQAAVGKLNEGVSRRLASIAFDRLFHLRMDEGRFQDAERLCRKALALVIQYAGAGSAEDAVATGNLAAILTAQGRYIEAEKTLNSALEIGRSNFQPNDRRLADLLAVEAELLRHQYQLKEAIRVRKEELGIREKQALRDQAQEGQTLFELAGIYSELGKTTSALEALDRADRIWINSLPTEHISRLYAANTRLAIYGRAKQYANANELIPYLLAHSEALGRDHPSLAVIYTNIAFVYEHQGRREEAAKLFERAYQIDVHALGPLHPETVNVLAQRAEALKRAGHSEEGRSLETQAKAELAVVH
jgi:tetratricopeptide (TPR) repeat protein